MNNDRPHPLARRSILIAAAIVVALGWSMTSGDLLHAMPSLFPYSRSVVATLSDVVVMLLLAGVASRSSPARLLRLSGVTQSPAVPIVWSAVIFVPATIFALIVADVSTDLSAPGLAWQGVGGPFFEELGYRGLAIGGLVRLAGWRLIPACIMQAVFFGAVHAYQGVGIGEMAGAVAITAAGGLLFGWLFWRWHWNLWASVFLHMGMNLVWMVFALGETAVGGWLGNGLRAAIVLGAILLTTRMVPKPRKTA